MGGWRPSSARIRAEIDALFATDRDLGEVVEDVARLGARLILQTALEAEVTEFLGRERYERSHFRFRFHHGARAEPVVAAYGITQRRRAAADRARGRLRREPQEGDHSGDFDWLADSSYRDGAAGAVGSSGFSSRG